MTKMKWIGIAILAGLTLSAGSALATSYAWTNALSDDWFSGFNWKEPGVPGSLDKALFTNANFNGTVKLTNNANVHQFYVGGAAGNVTLTLDVNGFTSTVNRTNDNASSFVLNTAAGYKTDFTVMSSQPGGIFDLGQVYVVALGANATNNWTLTGSNLTVNLANGIVRSGGSSDTSFNRLNNAYGTVTMSDGVTVISSNSVLFGSGSSDGTQNPVSKWIVTDPGTRLITYKVNPIFLGAYDTNMPTLVVSNQAVLHLDPVTPGANSTVSVVGTAGNTEAIKNANGKVIVTGAGSQLLATHMQLGVNSGNAAKTGGGYLEVLDGGLVDLTNGYLQAGIGWTATGTNNLSYGKVTVSGTGSLVRVNSTISLGLAGNADGFVTDGGKMIAVGANTIVLGSGVVSTYTNKDAYGFLVVSNGGSVVAARNITLGGNARGYGNVIVADKASLMATGSVDSLIQLYDRSRLTVSDATVVSSDLATVSNTTIRIELSNRDGATPYIQLSDYLTIGSNTTLEIGILGSFVDPGYGQEIQLIGFGDNRWNAIQFANMAENSEFTEAGHSFRINYYAAGGEIYLTAIPEPGTLGLIGAGLGLAALIRRRRG